jgi:hypothetical protein
VKVHASVQNDGTYLAKEIEVKGDEVKKAAATVAVVMTAAATPAADGSGGDDGWRRFLAAPS